jgi:molybdate transport system substrate-binding protein
MKTVWRGLAAGLVWGAFALGQAAAQDLQVLSAGAAQAAMKDIVARFAQSTGHTLTVDYAPVGSIVKRLAQGEHPDVLVVTSDVMAELQDKGWARPGTARPIGRVGMGVAVRTGAPLPDIATEASLRNTLLQARSITYIDPQKGTSGKHFAAVLQQLGLTEQMAPKTVLGNSGFVVEPVARGDVEMGIQQITEILPVQGATLVGPLPPSLQKITTYEVVLGGQAAHESLARAFEDFLQTPYSRATLAQRGFAPP